MRLLHRCLTTNRTRHNSNRRQQNRRRRTLQSRTRRNTRHKRRHQQERVADRRLKRTPQGHTVTQNSHNVPRLTRAQNGRHRARQSRSSTHGTRSNIRHIRSLKVSLFSMLNLIVGFNRMIINTSVSRTNTRRTQISGTTTRRLKAKLFLGGITLTHRRTLIRRHLTQGRRNINQGLIATSRAGSIIRRSLIRVRFRLNAITRHSDLLKNRRYRLVSRLLKARKLSSTSNNVRGRRRRRHRVLGQANRGSRRHRSRISRVRRHTRILSSRLFSQLNLRLRITISLANNSTLLSLNNQRSTLSVHYYRAASRRVTSMWRGPPKPYRIQAISHSVIPRIKFRPATFYSKNEHSGPLDW